MEQELPSFHKQWLQTCLSEHRAEAARWSAALRSGALFLPESLSPSFEASRFARCLPSGLEERCVYIHAIPPRCTRRCLLDWLAQFDGLQAVFFGDAFRCPPAELNRPAFALFASPAQTAGAFQRMVGVHVPLRDTACLGLNGLKEEEDGKPRTFIMLCSLWRPSEKLPPLRAIANSPRRLAADRANCRALWTAAERFWVWLGAGCDVGGGDGSAGRVGRLRDGPRRDSAVLRGGRAGVSAAARLRNRLLVQQEPLRVRRVAPRFSVSTIPRSTTGQIACAVR